MAVFSAVPNKRRCTSSVDLTPTFRELFGSSLSSSSSEEEEEEENVDALDGERHDFARTLLGTCIIDASTKVRRSAQYWDVAKKMREDALARGTKVTIGPCGYAGYAQLMSIERDFLRGMHALGKSWEIYQSNFFKVACNCNIKLILGDDVDMCLDFVMKERGWNGIPSHIFALAYRGAGKSQIAAYMIALFILYIHSYTVTIYGGPEDKCKDLFAQFKAYIDHIISLDPSRHEGLHIRATARRMSVRTDDGDSRWAEAELSKGNVCLFPQKKQSSVVLLLLLFLLSTTATASSFSLSLIQR